MHVSPWLLGLAGLAFGCSLAVDVERFGDAGPPRREEDCKVRFFRGTLDQGEDCERIGEVRVRDTGFSVNCGSDRVREEIRAAACELGGDSALLRRVAGPMMTCVQEDAVVFRCNPSGVVEGETSQD